LKENFLLMNILCFLTWYLLYYRAPRILISVRNAIYFPIHGRFMHQFLFLEKVGAKRKRQGLKFQKEEVWLPL
jgi:hypothetical protein